MEYLLELLEPFGEVSARRMFGGYGLYHDDVMFALVASDTLYLKTDDANRSQFEDRGLEPFRYQRKGDRVAVMSYYAAPAEALDDGEALCAWARNALDAALRAARRKAKKKKK